MKSKYSKAQKAVKFNFSPKSENIYANQLYTQTSIKSNGKSLPKIEEISSTKRKFLIGRTKKSLRRQIFKKQFNEQLISDHSLPSITTQNSKVKSRESELSDQSHKDNSLPSKSAKPKKIKVQLNDIFQRLHRQEQVETYQTLPQINEKQIFTSDQRQNKQFEKLKQTDQQNNLKYSTLKRMIRKGQYGTMQKMIQQQEKQRKNSLLKKNDKTLKIFGKIVTDSQDELQRNSSSRHISPEHILSKINSQASLLEKEDLQASELADLIKNFTIDVFKQMQQEQFQEATNKLYKQYGDPSSYYSQTNPLVKDYLRQQRQLTETNEDQQSCDDFQEQKMKKVFISRFELGEMLRQREKQVRGNYQQNLIKQQKQKFDLLVQEKENQLNALKKQMVQVQQLQEKRWIEEHQLQWQKKYWKKFYQQKAQQLQQQQQEQQDKEYSNNIN